MRAAYDSDVRKKDGSGKRTFRLRCWAKCGVILIGCVVAFYAFEHWRGWRAWAKFRAEWEANGEIFSRPRPPVVPENRDASESLLMQELTAIWRARPELFEDRKLHGDRGRLHEVGDALTLHLDRDRNAADLHFTKAPFAGARWGRSQNGVVLSDDEELALQQIVARFDEFSETLGEIDTMLELPALAIPEIDETNPAAVPPPHATVLASLTRAFLLRARAQFRLGNGTAPLADIERCFTMINRLGEIEGHTGAMVHSNGPFHILVYTIHDGLERELWSAEELLRLQGRLQSINLVLPVLAVLRQMRAYDIEAATSAERRALHNKGVKVWNARRSIVMRRPDQQERGYPWYEFMRPQGWRYLALRERLEAWQMIVFTKEDGTVNFDTLTADMVFATDKLKRLDSREPNRIADVVDGAIRRLGGKGLHDKPRRTLPELNEDAVFLVEGYGFRPKVRRQLAITAIALERFKLRHGSYPAELADLVPDFLDAPAVDPWTADGALLRYAVRSPGRPAIWSIGENGIDDGGTEDSDDKPWHYDHGSAGVQ